MWGADALSAAVEPDRPGQLVRALRLRAGLTQRELAIRTGLSVRALRDIELGRVQHPQQRSLLRLADPLELSLAERDRLIRAFLPSRRGPIDRRLTLCVLGPLLVHRGGHGIDLGPPLQRTLLGLLSLRFNELVSSDEIIDTLWGNDPPRSCWAQVLTMISRLRRNLQSGREAGSVDHTLRREGRGYRLSIESERVDAGRFDRLVANAHSAQTSGDPVAASALLEQALRCWRGDVLAGTHERLQDHPAALALSRRRLQAVVRYADLAAATGSDATAIELLQATASAEPLHEGVHARLMLALAHVGDRAAALQSYATFRRRLLEQLGVSPGAEVRRAHEEIVRQGTPWTSATGPRASATLVEAAHLAAAPVPAQLPASPPGFVGRAEELRRLEELASAADQSCIAVISGMAGVGKTTLAVLFGHRVLDRFHNGQLYVNLRGYDPRHAALQPTEVIRRFLEALGIPPERTPTEPDEQAALYRSLVAGRRMLIVLDNARNAEQVRPLLPGTPGSLVLVTSRDLLIGLVATEGAHPIALDLPSVAEARQLLLRRLGDARITPDREAVDQVIACCGRLPLALVIAAAHAVTHPARSLRTLAAELSATGAGIAVLAGDDAATDVTAVFSSSYRALDPSAKRLFRLLGLHPGSDAGTASAASILGVTLAETRALLVALTHRHLIREVAPTRYAQHDLLRSYARSLASTDDPAECRGATHRLLDHYLRTAHLADQFLDPYRDPIELDLPQPGVTLDDVTGYEQAFAWFDKEHRSLSLAVRLAAEEGFNRHAWQLARSLTAYFDMRGHWLDWEDTHRIALDCAHVAQDPTGQACLNTDLALAKSRLGRYGEAEPLLNMAIELCRQLGDRVGEGASRLMVGWIRERQGSNVQALEQLNLALAAYQAVDHCAGQVRANTAIGWVHARLGQYRQSLTYCERALEQQQQLDDPRYEAEAWAGVGNAHRHLREYGEAIGCFQRAAQLFQAIGDRYFAAGTLVRIGDTHDACADRAAARSAWHEALTIFEELHHSDAERVRAKLKT